MDWNQIDQDGNIMYKVSNNINGEVKEYDDDGKLRFEGEYKNGIRNGKGIEYYSDGNKLFEGEYLNGLKWEGKGYGPFNKIVYELKNGNGLMKEYYNNKLAFEGKYKNGKKNGLGKEYN